MIFQITNLVICLVARDVPAKKNPPEKLRGKDSSNLNELSNRVHATLEPSSDIFLSGYSTRALVQNNHRLTFVLQTIEQIDSSGHISVFGIETDKPRSMHLTETLTTRCIVVQLFLMTFTVLVIAFLSVENLAFHDVLSSGSRSV